MANPFSVARFILTMIPDVLRLFEKHRGNTETAKRDMQSLTDEINRDRRAVDAAIRRQRERDRDRDGQ